MRVFTRSIPSRTAPSRPRRIQKGAAAARRPTPTTTLARISTRRPTLPEGAAASAEADDEARRPFTALSQVHADFALARVPQEQASWPDLAAPAVPSPSLGFRGVGVHDAADERRRRGQRLWELGGRELRARGGAGAPPPRPPPGAPRWRRW